MAAALPDGRGTDLAVVTGAASGIGQATLHRLLAARWRVLGLDLEAGPRLDSVQWRRLDVADAAGWAALASWLREQGEAPRLVHLNAGVGSRQPRLLELTDDQYRRTMGVNLDGVVFGIRALAPSMPPGGTIVVTASVASMRPSPLDPVYAATKHAVIGLVRSIVAELDERGLAIHAVCPSVVDTPLARGNPTLLERVASAGSTLLRPDDVVDGVAAALASPVSGDAWVVVAGREPFRYEWPPIEE